MSNESSNFTPECLFVGTVLSLLLLVLPIINIIFATIYEDSTCNSIMTPTIWLYVSSIIYVLAILSYPICNYIDPKTLGKYSEAFFKTLYSMWLITGSIIFFRDCRNALPNVYNNFMWSILLFNWGIIVFVYLITNKNKSDKKLKNTEQEEYMRQLRNLFGSVNY